MECPFPHNFNHIPAATQRVLQVCDDKHMPLANKLSKFIKNVATVYIPSTIVPASLKVLRYARNLKILHCHIDHSEIPGILYDRTTEFCSSLEYLEVSIKVGCADDSDAILNLYDDSESAKSNTYLKFGLNI